MAKSIHPNPVLYAFFKFLSFILVMTIIFLLGVIYLLVNKNILPSFKLAHKKLEGKVAYVTTTNQINIYDGTNGSILPTPLHQTSSPGKKALWSPDGKFLIANNVSDTTYQYYDTARKNAYSIRMPFNGQADILGWVGNDTVLVSDNLNLYTVSMRGQNKKQICSSCTYASFDTNGINSRTHQVVVLKENKAGGAPAEVPYLVNVDSLATQAINVQIEGLTLDSYDFGSFSFDAAGAKIAFSFSMFDKGDSAKSSLTKKVGFVDVKSGLLTQVAPEDINTFFHTLTNAKIGVFGYPQFSPDGGTLSFYGFLGTDLTYYLMRTDLDGKNAEPISPVAADFGGHSWSSDSTWIIFTDQKGNLRASSRDGRNTYFLLDNAFQPSWSPNM